MRCQRSGERTTRRITLTHEGSAFLEDCQRILTELASAEASVSEGGSASYRIRASVFSSVSSRSASAAIQRAAFESWR